jgi:hypothetical protein
LRTSLEKQKSGKQKAENCGPHDHKTTVQDHGRGQESGVGRWETAGESRKAESRKLQLKLRDESRDLKPESRKKESLNEGSFAGRI